MLNAYINKEDINKLLDGVASVNGLISKKDFQKAVTLLKEYKKPQPNKPGNKINKVRDIISNITKYQNAVAAGEKRSDIMNESITGIDSGVHSIRCIKIYINRRIGSAEMGKNAVIKTENIAAILGVSIPTIHKWIKKNIITRHIPSEIWYSISANKEVRGRVYVPYYYDLEEIKNNLKHYK